jgi:hypothetical protein
MAKPCAACRSNDFDPAETGNQQMNKAIYIVDPTIAHDAQFGPLRSCEATSFQQCERDFDFPTPSAVEDQVNA